jgi:hypothetical protein
MALATLCVISLGFEKALRRGDNDPKTDEGEEVFDHVCYSVSNCGWGR